MGPDATAEGQPFPYALHKGGNVHSLVRSSSNQLIQAYDYLMQSYPQESPHNRQAFFDHLCALDFI